jgi:hypothetical protein
MADVGRDVESGMVSINHHGLALPELPKMNVKPLVSCPELNVCRFDEAPIHRNAASVNGDFPKSQRRSSASWSNMKNM